MQEIESLIGETPMPVVLERTGQPRRVPAIVGRSAYRVVRDALAAARAATAASVAIEFMPGALAVEVVDDGGGVRDFNEIIELAAALGGGLAAAPAEGGFRVRAWLPTEGQPRCSVAPCVTRG